MIETPRLILRRWKPEDAEPFATLNADPDVMRYFPAPLTREESDATIASIEACFAHHGFCAWAAELRATQEFIGFIGLAVPSFEAHFMPCVEVAWRLASKFWNQGLATEGAKAAIADGFNRCGLGEIVALAVESNTPSRRVMEKLGMTHNERDDFDHPRLAEGHPLRRHVLYRIRADRGHE